jgi:hypothetical protein
MRPAALREYAKSPPTPPVKRSKMYRRRLPQDFEQVPNADGA